MLGQLPKAVFAALLVFSGCLVPGVNGAGSFEPGLRARDVNPPRRARVLGTLWPPADEPMFVVGGRSVAIVRSGEPVAEAQTDKRGRFELRLEKTGGYTLSFSSDAHEATGSVTVVDVLATYRTDLLAHRL